MAYMYYVVLLQHLYILTVRYCCWLLSQSKMTDELKNPAARYIAICICLVVVVRCCPIYASQTMGNNSHCLFPLPSNEDHLILPPCSSIRRVQWNATNAAALSQRRRDASDCYNEIWWKANNMTKSSMPPSLSRCPGVVYTKTSTHHSIIFMYIQHSIYSIIIQKEMG